MPSTSQACASGARNVPAEFLNVANGSLLIVKPKELTYFAHEFAPQHGRSGCCSENPDLLGTGKALAGSTLMTHPIDHQIIGGVLRLIEDEQRWTGHSADN